MQVKHSNKHFQTFDLKTSEYFLDEVKTVLSTSMSLATTALQEKHNQQQQQQQISIFFTIQFILNHFEAPFLKHAHFRLFNTPIAQTGMAEKSKEILFWLINNFTDEGSFINDVTKI